jgi:hypothetical protein
MRLGVGFFVVMFDPPWVFILVGGWLEGECFVVVPDSHCFFLFFAFGRILGGGRGTAGLFLIFGFCFFLVSWGMVTGGCVKWHALFFPLLQICTMVMFTFRVRQRGGYGARA